jgi:hypothetical protein
VTEPIRYAKILNLSAEGCLLELKVPPDLVPDTIVEITFTVNKLPFRVRGRVKAVQSATKVGFHFFALSQRVRLQLQDMVEELGG